MNLTRQDRAFLIETLESCKLEFEELVKEKEWFVTETLDRIDSALEILEQKEV
jgi:hypothetical protein